MPLSKNLSEDKLKPYIQDALLMKVKPVLGELYAAWQDGTQTFMGSAEDGMAETDLVKAVWVFHAYVSFLPFHGISVSSSGVTKSTDKEGTFEQASHQERQSIIAEYRSKISYWEGELGKAIKAVNGIGRATKRKNRIGIRVVGAR